MKKSNVSVKVGDVVNVVFKTGPAHPLFDKVVPARIKEVNAGYYGDGIWAETLEPVHHPEDPEGIHVFDDNGKYLRSEFRPAFEKICDGWVEKIVA